MITDSITLPAGKYIIVDPCYVMPDKAYQHMIDTIFNSSYINENRFTYKGKTMVIFGTAYGDGGYENTFNSNQILVDSGLIAIIPIDILSKKSIKENSNNSAITEFTNSFECVNNNGILNFGHIIVDTLGEEEEDDDEWYEDDEDDEDFDDEDN